MDKTVEIVIRKKRIRMKMHYHRKMRIIMDEQTLSLSQQGTVVFVAAV